MKIGIIGDEETVRGFSLAGVTQSTVVNEENKETCLKAFREMHSNKDLAMLIITQRIVSLIRKELLQSLRESPIPAIVEIPEKKVRVNQLSLIESITSKAVGSSMR